MLLYINKKFSLVHDRGRHQTLARNIYKVKKKTYSPGTWSMEL